MIFQKTISAIFASSLILFASGLMAEGLADRRNEGPVNSIDSAMLVIQHIHNKFGPTAAGVPDQTKGVHMNKGEQSAHGHTMHPHTLQSGKSTAPYKKMSAIQYRKSMFGPNK